MLKNLTRDSTAQAVCDMGQPKWGVGTKMEPADDSLPSPALWPRGPKAIYLSECKEPSLLGFSTPDQGHGEWALTEVRAPFSFPFPAHDLLDVHL